MTHIVHRQTVELELLGSVEAVPVEHALARLCRERLPSLLEAVFDEVAPGAAHVRFDRLEVELGVLEGPDLEQAFIGRVGTAVRKAIDRQRAGSGASPDPRGAEREPPHGVAVERAAAPIAPDASDEALVRFFLETGLLPWWAERLDGAGIQSRFMAVLERHGEALPAWLRGRDVSRRMARRVAGQMAPEVGLILLLRLAGEAGLEGALNAAWETAPPTVTRSAWRHTLVEALLPPALAHPPGVGVPEAAWLDAVEAAAAAQGADGGGYGAVLRHAAGLPERAPRAGPPGEEAGAPAQGTAGPPEQASDQGAASGRGVERPEAGRPGDTAREIRKLDGLQRLRPPAAGEPTRAGREVDPARAAPAPPGPAPESGEARAFRAASEEGWVVDNAGLVLLHPFLRPFFAAVGLLEGRSFREDGARGRAVCLLQWLAHGEGAEDEHRMLLGKVLCGVPLEEVVPRVGGPGESERAEGEALLRHVVAQWGVLGNTSVEGLQSAFLRREGILRPTEGGWRLRMESRPHDVLLDRLPWGLSHIRLSWMAGLLEVER